MALLYDRPMRPDLHFVVGCRPVVLRGVKRYVLLNSGRLLVSFDNKKWSYTTFVDGDLDDDSVTLVLEEDSMKIERGLHTRGLQINLVLHSENVDTHGAMTDHVKVFNEIADMLQERGHAVIQETFPKNFERKP